MDQQFIQRKEDHLHYSLSPESQTVLHSGWDAFALIHDSLPDLDLAEVSIQSSFLNTILETPFFVPGMTAGHENATLINDRIANMASERGWLMGVGSQRRELDSDYQDYALQKLITRFPKLKIISNLGLSQLIELHREDSFSKLQRLIENTGATLIAIHLNPLQEAVQAEGTPQFKGGMEALQAWVKVSPVPVVVKETGSGMSHSTLRRLRELNLFAVDVSGMGGTHWGRVEGLRAKKNSASSRFGKTFENWGISTTESLIAASTVFAGTNTEIWASGGMRTGLDAAKAIALGATRVGFAQPVLAAALKSKLALSEWSHQTEQELKIAMFCTNSASLADLNKDKLKAQRV
jgi:isopentenyl-diphosphate Delta-isomerase